jgi:fructokinase
MRLIAVGEILWDLFDAEERLGGAVLNLAAHGARLGHDAVLVSAVGADERGARALQRARELGLSTRFVPALPGRSTGIVTVSVDAAGQPSYVIHRPAAYDFAALDEAAFADLAATPPDWICYGTLHSMRPEARQLLRAVIQRFPQAGRFYDVNLRRDSFRPDLVRDLAESATLVKLNHHESLALQDIFGSSEPTLEHFCRAFAARFGWRGVCVTRGERGCAILLGGQYEELPGYRVAVVDTVGAGDAFAAAFLHGISSGWPLRRIGEFANRLGALVAARPGGTPAWTPQEIESIPRPA